MKILVTGGAGFIGSHLVDALVKEGHQLAVIDDLSTGHKELVPSEVEFYQVDICQTAQVEEIFLQFAPEIIFHLAAQKDVRYSVQYPDQDAKVNILGSLNLIKLSTEHKIKKFIFVSSGGAIYDENDILPLSEQARAKPLSPYGLAKYTIDLYLEAFKNLKNLSYISLRLANVYGPRQDPKGEAGVVAIFFNKLINQQRPQLNGGGEQTRDFVYVKDVVRALILAATAKHDGVYNIGTSRATSIAELLKLQQQICQTAIEPEIKPYLPGEVRRNSLAYQLATQDLDWQPKYSLVEGLTETYDWFKNNL